MSDAKACARLAIMALPKVNSSVFNWNSDDLTSDIQKIISEEQLDRWDGLFGDKKIDSFLLKPNLSVSNKDNVFYNKKVVFTGDMEGIERSVAAKNIQAMGADINTSISKLTNIVVIGKGAGPAKMKKIQELIEKGYPLRLIYEPEFLSLMSNEDAML